jgi:hypothetical protein
MRKGTSKNTLGLGWRLQSATTARLLNTLPAHLAAESLLRQFNSVHAPFSHDFEKEVG